MVVLPLLLQISSTSDNVCRYLGTNDSTSIKADMLFDEYLHLLGLTKRYPNRLTLTDSLVVRRENIVNTDNPEAFPYLILQKIMMFDVSSRASFCKGRTHGSPALKCIDEIHPLDTIVTLLHCCDNFLTQDILTRLSTCQLAIPFLLPNPKNGNIRFLLWQFLLNVAL